MSSLAAALIRWTCTSGRWRPDGLSQSLPGFAAQRGQVTFKGLMGIYSGILEFGTPHCGTSSTIFDTVGRTVASRLVRIGWESSRRLLYVGVPMTNPRPRMRLR